MKIDGATRIIGADPGGKFLVLEVVDSMDGQIKPLGINILMTRKDAQDVIQMLDNLTSTNRSLN